jgi:glutamine cyclotransferase
MTQRPPTDRDIREALGGDRDVPPALARSISDYARATSQGAGLGVFGGLGLRLAPAGTRLLAVAVLLVVLLLMLGVAILVGSRPQRLSVVPPPITPSAAPAVTPTPTPGLVLPAGWTHVADVPRIDFDGVGPDLDGLLVLMNTGIGDLGFMDPAAGEGGQIIERLDVGVGSRDLPIAEDAEGWWMGVGGTHELVRFDRPTRSIVRRMQIEAEAYRVASDDPIVYVTDFANGRVIRVDTSTGQVTATRDLDQAAGVAVLDDGSVLVASRPGTLLEVDPVTLETLDDVTIQGDVMTLIPDGDRVIVTRNNADRLSTILPSNLSAGENLIETRISAFALSDDAAWGIDWQTHEILRLDRDSLGVIERVPPLSAEQDGISVVAGDLWIEGETDDGPVVHRVRPPALPPAP